MTFAVVQSSWENPEREFALILGQELRLTKIYRDLRKVNHKHYIDVKLGGSGTNVYDTWKTADGSADWMEECFRAQPRLTIDKNHLTLSNDANEVPIKGVIVKPPWLT
tara:strand:+ start:282 stop:605 length:324 start_codon:yes stop_codon:yes gene_type:complete